MNYDTLNRYALAAIACFAVALYVAVISLGWIDLKAHLKRRSENGKRVSNGRRMRRYQKSKRAS